MSNYTPAYRVLLVRNGSKLGQCRDCSVSLGTDVTERAGYSQGSAQEFLPGKRSWQVRVKQLIADTTEAAANVSLLTTGARLSTTIYIGGVTLSGYGYVSKIKHNYDGEKVASSDITIEGDGALTPQYPG